MPTNLLLWTDGPTPYLDAIAAAGLTERVTIESLPRKDQPSDAHQNEALLAWGAPPGLLPKMPNLKWAQALTAGVEGWLALPDLPPDLTLTCARGTHRESMPENIMGALFYLTKPYAACVEDQKHSKWTKLPSDRPNAWHPYRQPSDRTSRAWHPPSACALSARNETQRQSRVSRWSCSAGAN